MTREPTPSRPGAAVITAGTELVTGVHEDSNGGAVARLLRAGGFSVHHREVLPDDRRFLAERIRELTATHELVVVTGGLGPTHDDVTREAAADALGLDRALDTSIAEQLEPVVARHTRPDAAENVLRQAEVLEGALVLRPETGTAPGQLLPTRRGHLLLLPGPPNELLPMLSSALEMLGVSLDVRTRLLGCVGVTESDAQLTVAAALEAHPGIGLTVLSRPALVDVLLFDEGVGQRALDDAARDVAASLGDACYATDGSTLAQVVIASAVDRGVTLALAESCTGGQLATELTSVPGASEAFLGAVVAYSNDLKRTLLDVPAAVLEHHGAVSAETARAMASGIRTRTAADAALAVTGIAGPGGGTADKPVGTVWLAVDSASQSVSALHRFGGDRGVVRARATATALDMLRHHLAPSRDDGTE